MSIRFPFFRQKGADEIFLFSIGEQSLSYALLRQACLPARQGFGGQARLEAGQGPQYRVLDENSVFLKRRVSFFEEAVLGVRDVLKKAGAKNARIVIGLRPGVAKSEFAVLNSPLPFPGKHIGPQEEELILRDAAKKAERELKLQAAERTGLRPDDLVLLSLRTFSWRVDGYAVPRLRGFTGSEFAYSAFGVFLSGQSARQLSSLAEYSKSCEITIAHSSVALCGLGKIKDEPTLAIEIGEETTQMILFEHGDLRFLKNIPFGERDLASAIEREFGMKKDTSAEFLFQYVSGLLSEQARSRVRALLLPAVGKFATLIKEALESARSLAPSSLLLFGEESALPEIRELFEQEEMKAAFNDQLSRVSLLAPKDLGVFEGSSRASDPRYTPLYLLLNSMELGKKFTDIIAPRGTRRKETSVADISPVSAREEEHDSDSAVLARPLLSRRSPVFFWGLLFIGIAGAGLLTSFFLAKARVLVWPESRDLFIQDKIRASVSQTAIDLEQKIIPASRLIEEKESTRPFPATGKKTKETKAEGIIRVFNTYSTSPQTLVANTRFISENGILFRSKSKTTIPAARYQNGNLTPGTIDITVTAAESGASHNIGPSNFSLPGLAGTPLYTTIYGKSLQAMSGGSEAQVAVVTKDDIAHSKDQLIENLAKLGKEAVGAKIAPGQTLLPGFITSEVVSASALAKEGAELEQFNVTAKVKVTALLFLREDAESLMKYLLSKTVSENEQMDNQSVFVSLQEDKLETVAGVGVILGTAKAKSLRVLDFSLLKGGLNGLSERDASLLLAGYPGIAKYQLSFSPFWLKRFSKNSDNIEVAVPEPE